MYGRHLRIIYALHAIMVSDAARSVPHAVAVAVKVEGHEFIGTVLLEFMLRCAVQRELHVGLGNHLSHLFLAFLDVIHLLSKADI